MGALATIPMVALEWEHAWDLFKNKVGEDRLANPTILDLAQTIARTCKGLPMLLCTVGRALASMPKHNEWLDAINWVQIELADDGSKEYVFILLELCFDCLDVVPKMCLLYFCLFPEDFTILKNDLIDFWICERLLEEENDVLSLGYKTLDALIGACLLEEEQLNHVKLLDLIRDFGLKNMFRVYILEVARRSSVGRILAMRNSIWNLRDYLPNNLFLTFLLAHNPFIMLKAKFSPVLVSPQNEDFPSSSGSFSVRNFACSAFKFGTRKEKESKYEIEDVYESMGTQIIENVCQFIESLTVLDLSNSGVETIPHEISELVSLEYLNLSRTWIDHLPIEINKLLKLKCLNLEYNDQLRVIPKQLIFGLSYLRILKMFRCGFSVEEVDDNILSLNNMDADLIFCLEHLEVLSITITCVLALHKFFCSDKLLRCTQSLSLEVFWKCSSLDISPLGAMENLLLLEIHQFEDLKQMNCNPHNFELEERRRFENLREITLDKCSSLVEVTWVVLVPNLAILKVQNCEEMREVISSRRMDESFNGENWEPFAKLEIITLENLPQLKRIYWKALAFQNLKKIEVIDCCLLKKLPLDCHSANVNELLVIEAQEDWWRNIEWEDDDSRVNFLPCFKPTD